MLNNLSILLNELRSTNSTNDKVAILKNKIIPNNVFLLIKYALSDEQFYVTSENLFKHPELKGNWEGNALDLLKALSTRKITGHDAIKACNGFLSTLNPAEKDSFLCILDKDLKCGVNAKLANKAIPNWIPTFSVALANTWKGEPLNEDWVISRKLDGCFPYETPILLSNGKTMNIGEIVKNKLPVEVLSYNTKTKQLEPKKVINWFENGIKANWVEVSYKDKKVFATTNHKFFNGLDFVEIWESKRATILEGNDLVSVEVKKYFDDPFSFSYDIEVEDNHNYFAGGFLVHNCRLITFINSENDIRFFSRQGKEFFTLDVLKEDLLKEVRGPFSRIPTGIVLDGEICIEKDGIEDFQSVIKEVRRKDHTIEHPLYVLFDYLTQEEFYGQPSAPYRERLKRLDTLPSSLYTRIVEHIDYTDYDFKEWQQKVVDEGWEGLIVRKNVPYESKRSGSMLKIKSFGDAEYIVEDVDKSGTTTIVKNGLAIKVPAIKCLLIRHKGNAVGVGSGLTPEQRIDFLAHPEKIIGKTICVKFFSESQDENGNWSLRFPTVKAIYENGRNC